MSPPCDMANDGNISDVLLVRCDRDELGEWNDRIAKLKGAANPDQIKKHSEWFRKLVNQSRSEEHTSELQSLMRNSYAVFCLKQKKTIIHPKEYTHPNKVQIK